MSQRMKCQESTDLRFEMRTTIHGTLRSMATSPARLSSPGQRNQFILERIISGELPVQGKSRDHMTKETDSANVELRRLAVNIHEI